METDDLEGEVLIVNPLTTSVPHHIATSQLICNADQSTGFYMMGNIQQSLFMFYLHSQYTQQKCALLKSTTETLQKDVKYVQC